MPWREAEQEAHAEVAAMIASPKPREPRPREAVVAPAIPRRKPRKAIREAMPSMFDGMDDGASTTYQTGEM
jgi:hypothetical protein